MRASPLQPPAYALEMRQESGPGRLETTAQSFPAARYFQVHFEHIEALLRELEVRLLTLERKIDELQSSGRSGAYGRSAANGGSRKPTLRTQG